MGRDVAVIARALAILLVLAPAIAHAQATPPDAGVDAAPDPDAGVAPASFEPPKAIGSTDVSAPAGAPPISAPVVVTVKLLVDESGAVANVELVTEPQAVFDDAVIVAAKQFHFEPGRFGGKPVRVTITFTHTFLPAPPPVTTPASGSASASGSETTATLTGKLKELGTRLPVASATVSAEVGGKKYTVEADSHGAFELPLPPGAAKITVYAPSHNPFVQQETLAAHQLLKVTYLVERDRYDPYEIVVVGEQRREEVSRITLRGKEIQEVPGTFGDPFRVVQTLPGVASVVSLLPFPVVRGSSPSSTGFLIDGTEVPLLYHLLAGPSVIHPEFIDSIDFYPGGAPVTYGGYTGGIVDGHTARAGSDAHLLDFDANLLQAGALIREPIKALDATFTAAARYGYPGLLLSLATDQASLSYWDYQLRVDGGTKANGWTVFAFGARDELDTVAANADPTDPSPPLTPSLILEFDRLDLRYHETVGALETTYRVVGGYDHTVSNGTDFHVFLVNPTVRSRYKVDDKLVFDAGLDGEARDLKQGTGQAAGDAGGLATLTAGLSTEYNASAFVEALYRPTSDWLIRPGVRGDVYHDYSATKESIDPRLTMRYKLGTRHLDDVKADSDDSAIWLKGAVGIYHQPPRFVLPLPGLDLMPLKYGLSTAYQSSLGVELPLEHRFQLSTEAYFSYLDPTIFDLSTNVATIGTGANDSLIPTTIINGTNNLQTYIDRLTKPELGRAYGLEVMLKRQAKSGLFGWVSYTLSRSERQNNGEWVPYDYDRTQLLNLVAGLPLQRNWDIGLRMSYESGLPETTTAGYNTARGNGYVQFDVRVDKRAVWKKWLLDFYVDITNVALLPEEITPGRTIRYVLPTVGLRGRL